MRLGRIMAFLATAAPGTLLYPGQGSAQCGQVRNHIRTIHLEVRGISENRVLDEAMAQIHELVERHAARKLGADEYGRRHFADYSVEQAGNIELINVAPHRAELVWAERRVPKTFWWVTYGYDLRWEVLTLEFCPNPTGLEVQAGCEVRDQSSREGGSYPRCEMEPHLAELFADLDSPNIGNRSLISYFPG